MTFMIDGQDFSDCIGPGGLKWKLVPVTGPNGGRSKAGTVIRDLIAMKSQADMTAIPLEASRNAALINAMTPEFMTVTTTDARGDPDVRVVFADGGIASDFLVGKPDGTEYWENTRTTLVER